MNLKPLKHDIIRPDKFKLILDSFFCEYKQDLTPYKNGYKNKQMIYYNEKQLIVTEDKLFYLGLLDYDMNNPQYTAWKQHLISVDEETRSNTVQPDIAGGYALRYINKVLFSKYKRNEVDEILNSFGTEYDYNKKQVHIMNINDGLCVYKNCKGFDINGAHNDALRVIFPKCKDFFERLYNERNDKPNNKKLVNYYVGMLATKDKDGNYIYYPKAYNWIVQRTTKMLYDGMNQVEDTNSVILYANTDGFLIQNTDKTMHSTELGKFKLEMQGDVYTYRDKNYWCIQYTDSKGKKVLKGNLLNYVRDKVDLSKGQVVHYDIKTNEYKQKEAANIEIEIIKEKNIYD